MVTLNPARKTSSTAMELRGSLRYYHPKVVKEKGIRWPDPPHVYFANLQLDWKSLLKFDKTFGPLLREHLHLKREMAATTEKAPNLTDFERDQFATTEHKFEIAIYDPDDVQHACGMQQLLRDAWKGDGHAVAILQYGGDLTTQQGPYGPPRLSAVPSAHGIDIYAEDLWNYIRVAFLSDHAAGRTRVCANPDCGAGAPYFLAKRKDQRICGNDKCAAWAQREWALDWWKEKGYKRRRQGGTKRQKSQQGRTGQLP
jgi:hypothetical protein